LEQNNIFKWRQGEGEAVIIKNKRREKSSPLPPLGERKRKKGFIKNI